MVRFPSRPVRRRSGPVLGSTLAALALTGCATGGTPAGPQGPAATGAPVPAISGPVASAAAAADPGALQRPAPGRCVAIGEAADGVYPVFDAGTATVVRQGERLVPVDHRPAAGWNSRVDEVDDDDVEIDFQRGAEQLDLQVDLDDGVIRAEICADDD